MDALVYAFIFILGILNGGIVNVVIQWFLKETLVVNLPPDCLPFPKRLTWRHLVPVIFGFLYLYVFYRLGLSIQFVSFAFLFSVLFAGSIIDLRHRLIPDRLNLVGAVGGLLLAMFGEPGITESILGFFIGASLMLALAYFSKGGLGGGDIKLTAVLGLFLGWQGVLSTVFIASVLGSVVGILLNINKGKTIGEASIPFGPFLSMGAMTVYLLGHRML